MEPVHYPRCNPACDEHAHVLLADDRFEVPGRWPVGAWCAMGAVLIMVIALTVVGLISGARANAAGGDQWVTPKNCISWGRYTQCGQVKFRTQSDNTGVTLEGYWWETPNGCNDLESTAPYRDVTVRFLYPDGTVRHVFDMGNEPCNQYNNLTDWAGADVGAMEVHIKARAAVDNGGDWWVAMGWKIYPWGRSDLLYEYARAV
jgi:hypothetical protein